MLFGSGLILAALITSSLAGMPGRAQPQTEAELGSPARAVAARTAPMPSVDLTLRMPQDSFDLRSASKSLIKKTPIEVKSMKVVGASGFSLFAPAADDLAAGVGITAFKIAPHKRATQVVFGVRFRF